jgi:hypothetical protein
MKKIRKFREYFIYGLFLIGAFLLSGCKKMIEVDPPIDQIVGKDIYKSDATANSALIGIYTSMSNSLFTGRGIALKTGLSADELVSTADQQNILSLLFTGTVTNQGDQLFWTELYSLVFKTNSAIEGLTASTMLSSPVKMQLLGEAKFLRALMYFNLTNLYGDVPLLTTTDPEVNNVSPRASQALVYKQIVVDLKDAQELLNAQYVGGNAVTPISERLRPNKATATALLSKVYLYTKNWILAEEAATSVINNSSLYKLERLEDTFLKLSKEAIWQLQPVDAGRNTLDAEVLVLSAGDGFLIGGPNGDSRPVYMSKQLFNAFEPGDKRKEIWVDSVEVNGTTFPYSFKYKAWEPNRDRTEYLIILRLSELYLIRAEARAEQGNLQGINSAATDLNAVRTRSSLGETSAVTLADMKSAILRERQVELFNEGGNRWFDLKRTERINIVLPGVYQKKGIGVIWESHKALFPLPIGDILRNPMLQGHQNPGYPENF